MICQLRWPHWKTLSATDASKGLSDVKRRVVFLDRVYSIHSSVEDEVSCRDSFKHCFTAEVSLGRSQVSKISKLDRISTQSDSSSLQVVYPALDLKVKNVTHAYSVEHEDEVPFAFNLLPLPRMSSPRTTLFLQCPADFSCTHKPLHACVI